MPDLNGWPLLCLIVMAVVIVGNHLYEKGDR
jgi:hypothetical protein